MEISITLNNIIALFGAMIALAIIPDTSAITVAARSLTSGISHGLAVIFGILIGDFIFILLAVLGLSAIAQTFGILFLIIKYLGSAYLIWLGIELWRTTPKNITLKREEKTTLHSDFLCGLFITLGDPKAILFYISFLPAFLDMTTASALDIGVIMLSATLAVGSSKLVYAYLAKKSQLLFDNSKTKKRMNFIAGSVMISTGIYLMMKT